MGTTKRGPEARRVLRVLDEQRDACQESFVILPVHFPGGLHRAVCIDLDDGIERRVVELNSVEGAAHQLLSSYMPELHGS